MAVPEWLIEANWAASVASIGCSSFAATGEGVARIRASKRRGERRGERGERAGKTSADPAVASLRRPPSAFPLLSVPFPDHPPLPPHSPSLAASSSVTGVFSRTAPGGQPGGNRFDQARQSIFQGDEHAVAGAAFSAGRGTAPHLAAHRADQAAVLPLHLPEAATAWPTR